MDIMKYFLYFQNLKVSIRQIIINFVVMRFPTGIINLTTSGMRKTAAISLMAFCLLLTGCSTHKRTTKRAEYYKHQKEVSADIVKGLQGDEKRVIKEALTWLGTPYQYAGQKKGKGTDCSGFTMVVFEETIGCSLPRNSEKQSEFCKKINKSKVRAGDLVFFAIGNDKDKVNHVGIMIDRENFIHASASKGVIKSSLDTEYYTRHFRMFGRVPCMSH